MLAGKRILITGVVARESIACGVAEQAQRLGADVVLTGYGHGLALTRGVALRLPGRPEVLELDVNDPRHFGPLVERLAEKWGGLDGALHAETALEAFQTSAYALQALTGALTPLFTPGASVVGLDLDAPAGWPVCDWMGVSKTALRVVSRRVARELEPCGVRVNLVSATASAGDAVADAVCLLLSDRSGAMTGEVVPAHGA
jgi:enoyl-[acyl-carrier protein] reductase I